MKDDCLSQKDVKNKLDNLQKKYDNLNAEYNATSKELNEMKQKLTDVQKLNAGLKKELDSSKSEVRQFIYVLISNADIF